MKNKFIGIICFVYAFIIAYVWLFDLMKSFLAPNMQLYLKASIIPMIIMGTVLLTNKKINYKFKTSDLVLLLPLVMIFLAGNGNLSMAFAKSKITSISNRLEKKEKVSVDVRPQVPVDYEIVKKEDNDEPVVLDQIYFEIEDSNYSYLAVYFTYMSGAKKFIGKTIKVRGFAIDYSDYLTDDYFALGKYAITCCAADAEFSGFMIKFNSFKIKYGKWYEVEGVLEEGQDREGYSVMTINATSIKEISSKDEEQYVYSCASYGNGKCESLLKYDLDY